MVAIVAMKSWATYDPGSREGRLKSSRNKRLGNYTTYLATESRSKGRDAHFIAGRKASEQQSSLIPKAQAHKEGLTSTDIWGRDVKSHQTITAIPHLCLEIVVDVTSKIQEGIFLNAQSVMKGWLMLLQAKLQLSSSNHNPEPTNSRFWR